MLLSIPFWSDFIVHKETHRPVKVYGFQSHFGLILSQSKVRPSCWVRYRLSIPFWSDFIIKAQYNAEAASLYLSIPFWSDFISFYNKKKSRHGRILSIPFWSDFIARLFTSQYCYVILSIPFWSDFITCQCWQKPRQCSSFNPILVWFYRDRNGKDREKGNFQSHFGLILSDFVGGEKDGRTTLSIPFWSDFILRKKLIEYYGKELSIPFWSDFI